MAEMNTVRLAAEGRLTESGRAGGGEPLGLLGCRVVLEKDCTLDSWFRMLIAFPVLTKLSAFLPALLERYRQRPAQPADPREFECLELQRTVEMIGFPGKPRLEIFMSFQGLRDGQPEEIRMLQWERLLEVPLRLGRLRHVVFGDQVDVFEFDTVYTLFDLIDGIGWELSFHGTPTQCELRR